jgi:hypothetical protein
VRSVVEVKIHLGHRKIRFEAIAAASICCGFA